MKISIKQQKNRKKKIGMVVITGDGWVLFQGPVHTSKKMLFWMENGNKIEKKSEKKQGWIGDDAGTVFRVQCAFPNMETFAFLHKKQEKIGVVVSIVGWCIQGLGQMSKKGNIGGF